MSFFARRRTNSTVNPTDWYIEIVENGQSPFTIPIDPNETIDCLKKKIQARNKIQNFVLYFNYLR
jgi:hypothetical protein